MTLIAMAIFMEGREKDRDLLYTTVLAVAILLLTLGIEIGQRSQ